MASSSTTGAGQLLGWKDAQAAISSLARTIKELDQGLQGIRTGVNSVSRSRGAGLLAYNVWNGPSPRSQFNGNGGSVAFSGQKGVGKNASGVSGGGGSSSSGNSGNNRQGGGYSYNGGRSYGLKDTVSTVVKYGQDKMADQVTMQTTAYQAAQLSANSWNTLRDQAFRNNYTAQSTVDAGNAYATMSRQGMSPGSASFGAQWGYVTGTSGYMNPGMSQTQRTMGTTALWQGGTYNSLRGLGINTIVGGDKQSPRQIAQQIYSKFPELRNVKTKEQLSATLDDPTSGLNQSLNAWGLQASTLELVKGELRGMMLAQVSGGSASTYTSLANTLDIGTKSEKKAAQQSLKKLGIGGSLVNTLQTRSGTLRNQDVNINDSFTSGLESATKYLNQFSEALQGALNATGANSALGWASGAGSVLGSSVASGLGTYGAMRGLGGAMSGIGGLGGLRGTSGAPGTGAGAASRLGGAARAGAGAAAGVGAGLIVNEAGHSVTSQIKNKGVQAGSNVLVDAGSGALIGAGIGSVVPIVGTGTGALLGAGLGAVNSIDKQINPGPLVSDDSIEKFRGKLGQKQGDGISGGAGGGVPGSKSGSSKAATGTIGAGKTAASVISIAKKYLGMPYKWGGSSPASSFDCSGLVQYCFKQIGVSLPRTSQEQQKVGKKIAVKDARAGDLLFNGTPAHHVVLCIGSGKIIEAPRTGKNIRIRSYSPGEFGSARRILGSVGNMNEAAEERDSEETAGSTSNRLGSMGFGGDPGNYGSVEEVDALASGISAIGTAGSLYGAGEDEKKSKDDGDSEEGPSGPMPKGSVGKWIKTALSTLNQYSSANAKYVAAMIQHESGGNPRAINNWDSNAKAGHPSKGIMQTIDSTFKAYSIKGHKDIWNPVDNIIAGVRYANSRYGSLANVPGIKSMANGGAYKGYAIGSTNIDVDQTATVHKGEMIIPAYQAEAVRKALSGNTPLAGGFGGHAGGGSPTLQFNAGSVVISVAGAMDQRAARDAAQQFMQAIAEDDRINLIASGN